MTIYYFDHRTDFSEKKGNIHMKGFLFCLVLL